jgi:hypothetical protein
MARSGESVRKARRRSPQGTAMSATPFV